MDNIHLYNNINYNLGFHMAQKGSKGDMTVREAGKKGGETTKQRYGEGYYESIGKKGGQKVRELIRRGKEASK
jgi:hypothetical protein